MEICTEPREKIKKVDKLEEGRFVAKEVKDLTFIGFSSAITYKKLGRVKERGAE